MEILEKIPETNDFFEYENLMVTVTKTDERRVLEVMVKVQKDIGQE